MDCLCTKFNPRFSAKTDAKSGQGTDNEQTTVYFNKKKRKVEKLDSLGKKPCEEKSTRRNHWALFKKQSQSKQLDRSLKEKLKRLKKNNFELELMKTVDCFMGKEG